MLASVLIGLCLFSLYAWLSIDVLSVLIGSCLFSLNRNVFIWNAKPCRAAEITDVSKEFIASIFRVENIRRRKQEAELGSRSFHFYWTAQSPVTRYPSNRV
jgi:hypothetical protein